VRVHAVSYATPAFARHQAIGVATARRAGLDTVRALGPGDLEPDFIARHEEVLSVPTGAGYWLWKPWIISQALAEVDPGDAVVYMDAGVHFAAAVDPLVALLERTGDVLLLSEGFREADYTKRDAFVLLGCDGPRWWDTPQRFASVVVVRSSPTARRLVEDWLRACEDPRVLTDAPNEMGEANLPGFVAHRHDQSVLSLLSKRAGIEVPDNDLVRLGLNDGEHVLNHPRTAVAPEQVVDHLHGRGWLTATEARSLSAGPAAATEDP